MSDLLIQVEDVSKKFAKDLKKSLLYGIADVGRGILGKSFEAELRPDEFWAVRDVSFEVRRGECLGLIGHNGAGKSTLLKMLNGLIRPDKGRIEMRGRIGALIELGAGFNPILTGRENIYNSGAVLGFTRAEISRKFDEIVAFSELEDFLDMPVQNYSSGMRVRLGFAVAAQMEPDILLLDEVLAVGDVGFRAKCYNEMYRKMKDTAIIFVSHSMTQVGKICTRGILLHHGRAMLASNRIAEIISGYNSVFKTTGLSVEGNQKARITQFAVSNPERVCAFYYGENQEIHASSIILSPDAPFRVEFGLEIEEEILEFGVLLSFSDEEEKIVAQTTMPNYFFKNNKEKHHISINIQRLLLNSGRFNLSISIYKAGPAGRDEILLVLRNLLNLEVKRDTYLGAAPILYSNDWLLD